MVGKRIVFSLFALLASALALSASGNTDAGSYKALLAYTLSNYGAGANANSSVSFSIPAPDYNYQDSMLVNFSPPDGWTAMGHTLPIGAGVGTLAATSTVGITNGACNATPMPNFNLWNASVDTTDVLGPADMYFVLKEKGKFPIPKSQGDPNLEDYLEKYPSFLNDMFDPDGPHGPLQPLKPRARYAGHALVANLNILIQLLVFDPGQLSQLPGIYAQMDSALGRPTVVVLNNPVSQEEAPGPISDFCTPLGATATLYGTTTDNPATAANESGYARYHNPPANTGVLLSGTHMVGNYSQSERDADGDGFENDLDPCPYTQDLFWDPRVAGGPGTGDNDNDGLPDSCDPNDNDPNPDQDADGYNNRQDICPLVANGCKAAYCHPTIFNPTWDNQADDDAQQPNADLGPGPDSIGNACDDSDDDGNEDGAGVGTCNDGIDNGGVDGLIDGNDPDCVPKMDKAEVGECRNNTDDDPVDDGAAYGTWINDGCPVKGAVSEASITGACDANNAVDDDGDTRVNDGCPTRGTTAEAAGTTNDADIWGSNPGTGSFFHAMPLAAVCVGGMDTDGDGYCNALEDMLGATTLKNNGPEAGTQCDNNSDDDSDGYVNDGCPMVGKYIERGAKCLNNTSDDTPTPDAIEQLQGVKINDGCPVIGVPESLVIDAQITVWAALPSADVPQSCSDGIDNDGDGTVDTDDTSLGCNPAHASYTGDTDKDGKLDASDNCPSDRNPTQTWTDGHHKGDPCDLDDDDDFYWDTAEWAAGSDPLDGAIAPEICDGVDNDLDRVVDEGFPDTNSDGTPDCRENDAGQCAAPHPDCDVDGDTLTNGIDRNDDSWWDPEDSSWHDDDFDDVWEQYVGTDKDLACSWPGGPDADPFDPFVDGKANVYDGMEFYEAPAAYGTSTDKDDSAYNRRLDIFGLFGGPDGRIGNFEWMCYQGTCFLPWPTPAAYGHTCPYGR